MVYSKLTKAIAKFNVNTFLLNTVLFAGDKKKLRSPQVAIPMPRQVRWNTTLHSGTSLWHHDCLLCIAQLLFGAQRCSTYRGA